MTLLVPPSCPRAVEDGAMVTQSLEEHLGE
eukprot:COSAG06_NODE_23007_length_705_cov_1.867987_1_plen_29_part_01